MIQKNNKKSKKNKNLGFAWILWFLIVILILLIFLVKKDTILSNLKTTNFFERVFGSTPEFIEKHEIVEKDSKSSGLKKKKIGKKNKDEIIISENDLEDKDSLQSENKTDLKNLSMDSLKSEMELSDEVSDYDEKNEILILKNSSSGNEEVKKLCDSVSAGDDEKSTVTKEINDTDETDVKKDEFASEKVPVEKSEKKSSASESVKKEDDRKSIATAQTSQPAEVKKMDLSLCFLLFDSDGGVSRKIVKRSVQKNDSPLTESINLLLRGPDVSVYAEKDCISLIPEETRLLSARVQNGIAYLNFSEEFEFNTYAAEGYRHQLEQIVYTATAFSTVKSVQFLIEGKKEEYLGSEGVWIGSPLSRSSF